MIRRAPFLVSSDAELLAQCEIDRYRASGPGGQKRNKTDSAIRLRHKPSGMSAIANESRSQHENKGRALRRLREQLAVEFREPIQLDNYQVPPEVTALFAAGVNAITRRQRSEPPYLIALGAVIDLFVALDCSMGDTARTLAITTSELTRLIHADEPALRKLNELRSARNLKPLR